MLKRAINLIVAASLALASTVNVFAQSGDTPANLADLQLANPVEGNAVLSSDLVGAEGRVQVVVRLSGTPAGRVSGASNQRAQAASNTAQQEAVIANILAVDASAVVLGRTRVALNAVIVEMEGAKLSQLTSDLRIAAINPVVNYELDLSETVPYIGATAPVQAQGSGGAGIKVAVLDSGIDYTHAAFGGAGTLAAYQAAYGTSTADAKNTTRDGLFPTARVVEGFDFVGEVWTGGAGSPPLIPDDDPIDCGVGGLVVAGLCAGGHGTHVADIIGGNGGVAPNVSLYAVKVCSAVSTSCSGTAILQGLDYAIDPDGNGDTSDRVDIINMSLGAPYGHNYDHPFALSIETATNAGTLTVASAGNSADKPYITGTPAGSRTALSVAQTEVPSARIQGLEITAPAAIVGTLGGIFQPWSAPLVGSVSGPVQFGNGAGGNTLGCTPFPAGSLTGKIVLVDRGTCGFSTKIANINAGGALAGIIGLIAPGDPFSGGFTAGTPAITMPGYMILQSDANKIKGQLGVGVSMTISDANQPSLVGTVVGSSSRGPAIGQAFYGNSLMYGQIIKPEIGAPGASISAIAGSGTGTEAFGGTSGAAPMVAGSAALLRAAHPFLSPQEVKAVLMNNAETNIFNRPALFGGGLAPISRIGGGEVRVDRAMAHKAAAWEQTNRWGALAFGFVDVTGTSSLNRTVVVRNYSNRSITYNIASNFRFADDAATGAVTVSAPASISVPANSSRTFRVTLTIDGSKLRPWGLNLGTTGGDAATLTTFEYDGYVTLTSATANTINLPWHVIPRRAARVSGPTSISVGGTASYSNNGAATAAVDAYALVGSNPFNQATGFFGAGNPVVTLKNVGVRTFAGGGACGPFIWQFAVNAYQRTSTPQAAYQARINLDVNRDGVYDFQVRNADFTLNQLTDGRNLSWVVNLRTGAANAFFSTTHTANTANMVLTICSSQLADAGAGIPVPAFGQLINARAASFDNYFTGLEMSFIDGMVLAPAGEKYAATIADIPAGGSSNLSVSATGFGAGTSETGVLLMLDGQRGTTFNGNPDGREAIAVTVNP